MGKDDMRIKGVSMEMTSVRRELKKKHVPKPFCGIRHDNESYIEIRP
jgi:hypothetical protein